jgi:hypothetical protein
MKTLIAILTLSLASLALSQTPTPTPTPFPWEAEAAALVEDINNVSPQVLATFVETNVLTQEPTVLPAMTQTLLWHYFAQKHRAGDNVRELVDSYMRNEGFAVYFLYTDQELRNNAFGKTDLVSVTYPAIWLRFNGSQVLMNDYGNSLRGKGVTNATYLDWFREKIATMEPVAAIAWLEPEIVALLAAPANKERDAALIDLRGRFLVLKELAGG